MNNHVKLEVEIKAIPMVPVTYVSTFIWNERLGKRLEFLRGGTSRREICEKLKNYGFDLSIQGLAKIEKGGNDSIKVALILTILEILGRDLDVLYPVMAIEKRVVDELEKASPKFTLVV